MIIITMIINTSNIAFVDKKASRPWAELLRHFSAGPRHESEEVELQVFAK